MPRVMKLNDETTEVVFDDNDYIMLLKEHLGEDAADYFDYVKTNIKAEVWDEFLANPYKYCNGNCTSIRDLKKSYTNKINNICNKTRKLYTRLLYMKQIDPSTDNGLGLCADVIKACDAAIQDAVYGKRS